MPVLAAVLLCGGKGSRMLQGGVTTHKPLLEVGGMPATRFVVAVSYTHLTLPTNREV